MATIQIKKLKDKDGDFFPVTHERAVRDDDGNTLESKLAVLDNGAVRADVAQSLTDTEKAQALANLGISIHKNTQLVGDVMANVGPTPLRNAVLDETYGLRLGYYATSEGVWTPDATKASTKFINGINKPIEIKTTGSIKIAGVFQFDSNYSQLQYISVDSDTYTTAKGYYYGVTFKSTASGDLDLEYVLSNIYIGASLQVYELKFTVNELEQQVSGIEQETNELVDKDVDVQTLAEEKAWYQGTTIGATLSKSTENGCFALKYEVTQGEVYQLKAKGGNAGRAWYLLDEEEKVVDLSPASFNGTIDVTIPNGATYIIIQSNAGLTYLALKRYGHVSIISKEVDDVKEDIGELELSEDSFKCLTPFLWNKLARMKTQESGFCNIGFIGDSWTQGTENIIGGVNQGDYEGYVKHLTKFLQNEYGFGGLGWLDFARNGGAGTMFGCAEMYEHWTYAFSGNVTGVDGDTSAQAPNALGLCCAHTIFGNGATLSLTFNANYLDVFKLRYYKNAHFSVSVNGGTAVEITANANDGWQETSFGTTGTNITSVVITSLADNTIIFGMDCFYGTKGVRCHKIGNRSLRTSYYLLMNATQWETGLSMLDLCWASVLFAINDLGDSTDESKMNTIVASISNLIDRIKVATDDGNGLVTCDLNVLGIDNIEHADWVGLGMLAQKQKKMAYTKGYGWCSTDKCIGTTKAEFTYTGTFSDTIHLNAIGSYAYAKHIYDSLFNF